MVSQPSSRLSTESFMKKFSNFSADNLKPKANFNSKSCYTRFRQLAICGASVGCVAFTCLLNLYTVVVVVCRSWGARAEAKKTTLVSSFVVSTSLQYTKCFIGGFIKTFFWRGWKTTSASIFIVLTDWSGCRVLLLICLLMVRCNNSSTRKIYFLMSRLS